MNIILLISDTFRYDNLFDRAAMPVKTPNLDAFSERAVSMDNMYTASFPTIPHRTDVTTGRFGWPWYGWQDLLKWGQNHIPRILSKSGYVSQLLCDCPHLFKAGFPNGFDGAHVNRGQEGDTYFLRMNHPIEDNMPRRKTRKGHHFQGKTLADISQWTNMKNYREEDRFAPKTARLTIEWLEENYQWDPFFLWVDFFDPHEPWDPPEYMVRKYDPDYEGPAMIHPNYGKASDYTQEELKNLRAHYCAEAEMVDRWVGRVIEKIDDLQLWDNSIVIFTADHGMSLGEHNRTGKTNINDYDDRCWPIYPEIAHIPFMIAAPGLKGGTTIDTLAQPPDILPTVLDLAGVENVESPEPMHGISFASQLKGESNEEIRDIAIAATFSRKAPEPNPKKWTMPVIYTKQWAYAPCGMEGDPELYDLLTDPYAEKNIFAAHSAVVADLTSKAKAFIESLDAPPETLENTLPPLTRGD